MVYPVVLGAGERLFGDTTSKQSMRLLETRTVGDSRAYLPYELVPRGLADVRQRVPRGPSWRAAAISIAQFERDPPDLTAEGSDRNRRPGRCRPALSGSPAGSPRCRPWRT